MTGEDDVAEFYASRIRSFRASHDVAALRWRRLANSRLVVFVLAAASIWWAASVGAGARLLPLLATIVAVILFVYLVVRSSRARASVMGLADLILINEEGLHRVRRDWSAIERRAWDEAPASHPYAADLDVFGSASLVQLLPALSSAPGRSTIASWLLAPAPPDQLALRQQAVAELKDSCDWRDEMVLHTRRINTSAARLRSFQDWIDGEDRLAANHWLTVATIAIPVATGLLAAAQALGILTHAFWLIPVAAGALCTMRFRGALRITLGEVQGQRNVVGRYATVAALVSTESFNSDALLRIQHELSGSASAAREMRALERLADCADVRLSPMLHFFVQALTLWDFHVVYLLARWKRRAGSRFGAWMEAIGDAESLAALATVAHDNPAWVFPDVGRYEPVMISAIALGHPLISDANRVANDVVVGPAGTLLFVTGSNMAGKSTLLRAIGLNVVLAQAGSVVCATAMKCPPVTLYTSMRVQDSLERGVSYFMAELERLKLIVDAAGSVRAAGDRTMLYLLDEILHGTNSAERAIAARHVLARLITLGAIGAVTTHDLQLAHADALTHAAQHFHFREGFVRAPDGHPSMYFDYKLLPGKATSSNALKLLELVGLATDVDTRM